MPEPRSGWDERDAGRFVVHLPTSVDALPGARHDFSQWLERCRVARDISGELLTAFSELVANAIHAADHAASEALACAWRDGDDVVLEVANATPGSIRPVHRWDLQDQLRAGGRGLQIVQAFTDSVEIDQDDQGRLIVRCRRSLAGRT